MVSLDIVKIETMHKIKTEIKVTFYHCNINKQLW